MRPSWGGRRRGPQGAETLEFLAVLPLMWLAATGAWQGVALAQQQIEAQSDARAIVREAAICNGGQDPREILSVVDPSSRDVHADVPVRKGGYVTEHVSIAPDLIFPGLTVSMIQPILPSASATMREEC